MQWIAKQIRRAVRFAALLPHLFSPPSRIFTELPELSRIIFFNGFEGFKAFCRRNEAIRSGERRWMPGCWKRPPPRLPNQPHP